MEHRDQLMTIFKSEYAGIYGVYKENKDQSNDLIDLEKKQLRLLIEQELAIGGVESEFTVRRVPKI